MSGLIWFQTVCKDYQQTTIVTTSKERSKDCILKERVTALYSGNPITSTLANSEDPDEMQHIVRLQNILSKFE